MTTERARYGEYLSRPTTILVLLQVHKIYSLPNGIAGEVYNDVIALCYAELIKLSQRDRAGKQVAIIGNLDHGRAVTQSEHKEP